MFVELNIEISSRLQLQKLNRLFFSSCLIKLLEKLTNCSLRFCPVVPWNSYLPILWASLVCINVSIVPHHTDGTILYTVPYSTSFHKSWMIIRNTFSIGTSDIDRVETHQTASHFCQTGNCGTMLTLMHTRLAHKMGRYEFHGTTGQNLMIIEA